MDTSFLSRIDEIQSRIGAIRTRFGAGAAPGFEAAVAKATGAPEAPASQPSAPAAATSAVVGPYGPAIATASARHGVDADLVAAVMKTESNFNPRAKSPVGAIGLMQLMPGTARALGVDPQDPVQNIEGGAKYLGELTRRFGLEKGVAAYNAGPGAVEKHGGVPPYKETKAYVERVLSLYHDSKKR